MILAAPFRFTASEEALDQSASWAMQSEPSLSSPALAGQHQYLPSLIDLAVCCSISNALNRLSWTPAETGSGR